MQNINHRDIEDHDSDSSFENPYNGRTLFWENHGREKCHGDLDFNVDLPEFFDTLQVECFID